MNPSTSLLLCLCPLNAVAVLRGPVLLKEISTSQLKGLIKPTTRAKERHNRSIQQLRLAPLTHSVTAFVSLRAEVSCLCLICGCAPLCSGVLGPQRQARVEPLCLFVCLEDLIDSNYGRVQKRAWSCVRMQALLHAPEMHARTRKKCKYKYIKDKQKDKCIHIAGVLQTNTSSVHLFSACSIFLSGK